MSEDELYNLQRSSTGKQHVILPTYRVSHILDSHLKYNTALALTFMDVTIVIPETACLACIIEKEKSIKVLNGLENPERNRWVIFRSNKMPQTGRSNEQPMQFKSRRRIEALPHRVTAPREDHDMEMDER